MKNSYSKTKWVDNKTPVNAQNLNKIEDAIGDIYTNALDYDDLVPGEGIEMNVTDEGKKEISIAPGVMFSDSCTGIEWTLEEPETPEKNKLYFILNAIEKSLSKIMLNGVTIFQI